MCGIVGAAGDLGFKDKDALTILMHLCELRGEDSTGFFTIPKNGKEAYTHKVVGGTRAMFDTRQWDKWRAYDERAFVGHCRKATVGGISRHTAHPFSYDHITGVHNGTLRNWRYLVDKEETTDSMTLYKAIAEKGVRPVIEATDGAYAMVWWDEAEETLNFLRNKERPLHWCMSKDRKVFFWASEAWMLNIALAKAGIDQLDLSPQDAKHFTGTAALEEDTWWRIKLAKRGEGGAPFTFLEDHDENLKGGVNPAKYQAVPFQGAYRSPVPMATPAVTVPGVNGNNNANGIVNNPQHKTQSATTGTAGGSTTTEKSTTATPTEGSTSSEKDSQQSRRLLSVVPTDKNDGSETSTSTNHEKQPKPPLRINGEVVIEGYNSLTWNKKDYETWVEQNCVWCKTPVSFEEIVKDPTIIGEWTDEDEFICQTCCENYDLKGMFARGY